MIRNRMIFLFLIQIIVVLFFAGSYLRFYLQGELEGELAAKLESIASTISINLDVTLVSLLGPGDENTRTYQNLLQQVSQTQKAARLKRIVVMTPSGSIWIDSEKKSPIGTLYFLSGINKTEVEQVLNGKSSNSPLFRGNDGKWYKTGYASLKQNERVVGIIAVEGSAETLKTVNRMQTKLYQIGFAALIFSFILAVITSQTLTKPLLKLQQSAKKIGQGFMQEEIKVNGTGETAVLAKTMEEMRTAILKRDEQQKAMLAGVAHEIRNPLGGIELFAGLLKEELTDSQQKENADKILKETRNLKTLVQNFLDFGKPISPKREPCSILSCWEETSQLLQDQLRNIKVELSGDVLVFADPQHVKQVLMNLVLNSSQAMNGNGHIKIELGQDTNYGRIIFADDGEGIPPDIQPNIFEPFYSNKETGLGLGLAMSKNLVEQNGGSLGLVESIPGKTVFQIELLNVL